MPNVFHRQIISCYISPSDRHQLALMLSCASRYLPMSGLFELGDDSFHSLLSWFDFGCLCKLDIAIGNAYERLLWLHSLHMMDSKAVDEYKHSHASIRWLIRRGARATSIRIGRLERDRITDQTFAGVGSLFTSNADRDDRNPNFVNGSACTLEHHGTVRDRLRSREIAIETITCASVRPGSCHHLTSIDLECCQRISNSCLSTVRKSYPLLTVKHFPH